MSAPDKTSKFYKDLAEDARLLAGRLQDRAAQALVLNVSAAFARAAAGLETEERHGAALNAFVTESNVELYLSKAYQSRSAEERDKLLRLVADEEARMGERREHRDNGQRRVNDCEQRAREQRELVCDLRRQGRDPSTARFVLETYEKTVVLLRDHQQLLAERFTRAKL
jgi:hypothetical protein